MLNTKLQSKLPVVCMFLALLFLPFFVGAQTATTGMMENVKAWIIGIANVVFIIGMVLGIIRVVISFIQGNPNASRHLAFLVLAALIFFAFNLIMTDFTGFGGIDGL